MIAVIAANLSNRWLANSSTATAGSHTGTDYILATYSLVSFHLSSPLLSFTQNFLLDPPKCPIDCLADAILAQLDAEAIAAAGGLKQLDSDADGDATLGNNLSEHT
jgi:hypothetical protein